MKRIKVKAILALFVVSLFSACSAESEIIKDSNSYIVKGDNYEIVFDASTGVITKLVSCGEDSSITAPEGLWRAEFRDGKFLNSTQAQCSSSFSSKKLRFNYKTDKLDVTVDVTPKGRYCDFQAKLNLKEGELLNFELPAYFRFSPDAVTGVSVHSKTPRNIGLVFNSEFFKDNSKNRNSRIFEYDKHLGVDLYKRLFGVPVDFQKALSKQYTLTLGKDADFWLPKKMQDDLIKRTYRSVRSFGKLKPDIEILNSENGTFLGASRLGGKGAVFRTGGFVNREDRNAYRNAICTIVKKIKKIAQSEKSQRSKIALLKFNGLHSSAEKWEQTFNRSGIEFEIITSPENLEIAMQDPSMLLIFNPYAEACPNVPNKSPKDMVDRIKTYVKDGGYWFETDGVPFYRSIAQKSYFSLKSTVPSTFGDFFHFVMRGKNIACFSVQDIKGASFEKPEKSFIPSKYLLKGDAQGGYFERPFVRYMKAPESWNTPKVRFVFGKDLQESADAFCKANGVTKKFSQKLEPELREKFVNSVMYKLNVGNLKDIKVVVDALPPNNIIHISSYLMGGFDKQYPDHVPPRKSFSTAEEFKAWISDIQAKGHLFMPYTNNSWWCDNPRGPTFIAAGEAPLSIGLDGKHYHEMYAKNDGWTTCMWHPEVRKANRQIVKDFTEDYPCDILFQDQTGARASRLDFNPAVDNPNRYNDGFIFQAREDSKKRPLSTEDGWWGIANEEIQFCGMSFGIYDNPYAPDWNTYVWELFPKDVVRIANLAGALFHDKVSLCHHDLATSIFKQRQLSISLGIGFTMINMPHSGTVKHTDELAFIYWLDRLQKSIVSKYIGEKMISFDHRWKDTSKDGSDAYFRAQYGDVKIFASTDTEPFKEGNLLLAPEGFIATTNGVEAACVLAINDVKASVACSYLIEKKDGKTRVWTFAQSGHTLIFPMSEQVKSLKLTDGTPLKFKQTNGVVSFEMPLNPAIRKHHREFKEIIVEL